MLLVAALGVVTSVAGQTLIPQQEREPILDTLASLKVLFERCATDPGLRPNARRCIKSVEYFRKHAMQWEPRRPKDGEGMRIALQNMLEVMQKLPNDPARAARIVGDLADDLDDKESVCWRHGLDAQPLVEVRTKRNGTVETAGLEVWYIEKFLASDATAKPRRFPGFSSPVTDQLVPGRYIFWASDPSGRNSVGEKTEQRVAANGYKLPVPIRIEVLAP